MMNRRSHGEGSLDRNLGKLIGFQGGLGRTKLAAFEQDHEQPVISSWSSKQRGDGMRIRRAIPSFLKYLLRSSLPE
jgi:hypothetical protein